MSKNNPNPSAPIRLEDVVWTKDFFGQPYQAVVIDIKDSLLGQKYLLEEPLEGIDSGFDFSRTKWHRGWRIWK